MNRREPLQVELPPPSADQPAWAKVGVVAAVCFAIGVAWPRLAGWHIGPTPPQEAHATAISSSTPAPAKSGVAPAGSALPALAMTAPNAASANEEQVLVSSAVITKCRDAKGKTPDKCDELALDPLFSPRLKELAKCSSAIGLAGKMTISFDLDFKKKSIKVQRAKAAKLPRTTIDGITRCAEKGLAGLSLDDLTHESSRYSSEYTLAFFPPGKTPIESALADEANAGTADDKGASAGDGKTLEIQWNSTQVRNAPKNGDVVARLVRGNKVHVTDTKDGWLKIDLADGKTGWIYKAAVGE